MGRTFHKRAAAGGWAKLDLVEQLANIGREVERAIRAHEEFCRLFFDPEVPPGSADGLRKYFFGFAHAARMRHYRRT